MQAFFQTYGKEIVSLVVPLLAWVLSNFFKARARLLVARPHAFTFLVQEPLLDQQGNQISPTQTINTSSFVVANVGRESATKVEVVFNWKPQCVNLWPARHYQERVEPDNRYTITLDSLAPREDVGFHMFSINNDLPAFMIARCDQCVAQPIYMVPQPVVPAWKRRTFAFLAFAGLSTIIYAAIVLLQFLVLKTPFGH
ncbi:hypothetical protein [Cognatiluteimonas weifangensis]|uniref:Uncharacterized protein n=1 Tax=Cognatiluteimonas weifangensis TaxID=2303539 RepID=A0A372DH72_9GAMM|nr:hypothetical protein [Luteimonas weifangensis]RFP58031.1 hypothetical protein D0Y53_12445 [Luteimonas weifangensis]